MDSLLTIMQKKRAEGIEDLRELGRAVAKVVPGNWKITLYACMRSGIAKEDCITVIRSFIEEQRQKPVKFKKGKGSKKDVVDDGPEQLELLE